MCRNIRTLFNFAPPVTEEEIRAASLQFVRKLSGFNKPSKANEAAFFAAVEGIASVSGTLLIPWRQMRRRGIGKWKPPRRARVPCTAVPEVALGTANSIGANAHDSHCRTCWESNYR